MTSTSNDDDAIVERAKKIPKTLKRRYRMVALDLDGTLLSTKRTVANVQAEYLRGLSEKGFHVCIATGRAATGTYDHAAKLQIPKLPVVCSNGSRGFFWSPSSSISDGNEDDNDNSAPMIEELFHHQVPKEVVQRAIRMANQHGYCIQYYYMDSVYANQKNPTHYKCTTMYTDYTGVRIDHIDDDFQELLEKNHLPSKLLLLFDDKDGTKARQVANEEFDPTEATIVKGYCSWFMEILNATSNKGVGLRRMCHQLEIPLDQVIAIGDGCNDLEFLQMAGLGVAVKNAEPEVKEIADINLDFTNDDHGPMRILQELEEKGELAFQ
ncbi:unnamed protein product [Cylindrotheca closterium]|uniref:Uncharacterized protein n=1 Tax=Cylindrotheca closterium TaxID=2856 RepID=A0AAD2FXN3_9STRA|nr:unnamed protein product [Cylindrotheca closterium]